ncbi:hypothetical protein LOD44_11345 [Xylella fastidiosa subsp. multiplex]|uniref:Uncharacterized protein n=4 Tax=Xylella fastidiosa TaxID=2371 RepID=A0A9Q4QRL8_XYLFS|nr:hypothetical protein [Xylella fastidiosa]KAJ4851766.1 hypothetical protein XYFPCFBP8418_007560 [Xylella fastidiosa subsp. multiplex]KAJ4852269.1 hypothetical protein XYFPCFBP8418_010390 [Xylella fastidiosa subsp. multiplex]MBE0269428.1 hypothetical protein [Xylella fastidiosa subsp. multiplex]MBE0275001.1 hypothetical protein [Xylella fastidiosa subsp. multiplex]MBE0277285.1 hypothetical protein [Xylella fastidiosa subsp. multiplex]
MLKDQNEVSAASEASLTHQADSYFQSISFYGFLVALELLNEALRDAFDYQSNLSKYFKVFNIQMFDERRVILDGVSDALSTVRLIIKHVEDNAEDMKKALS